MLMGKIKIITVVFQGELEIALDTNSLIFQNLNGAQGKWKMR